MDSADVGSSADKELHGNDALFSCKSLLTEVRTFNLPREELEKRVIEICEADNTATREKLYCYCSLDFKGALKYLEKDIKGIRFQYDDSVRTQVCINVALPAAWVIGREGDMSLYCRGEATGDKNILSSDITLGQRFVEEARSRKIMSVDDQEKVVLRFVPESGNCLQGRKIVVLVMRYDRGVGKSFQVAVQGELDMDGRYVRPSWEGLGKWVKGDRVGAQDINSQWDTNAYFQKIEYEASLQTPQSDTQSGRSDISEVEDDVLPSSVNDSKKQVAAEDVQKEIENSMQSEIEKEIEKVIKEGGKNE
jgi:hypothetical protein